MESPKLSCLAQFDDIARFVKSVVGGDDLESKMKELIQSCETQRLLWLLEHNELNEFKSEMKRLRNENKCLETTLKNVREAFKKELSLRERLQSERDMLYRKLIAVQQFLKEDIKVYKTEAKEKVLSSLNLNKLQPVHEESSCSEKSLSDIEFDKTDEDIFDDKFEFEKRLSNAFLKTSPFHSQPPANSTALKHDIPAPEDLPTISPVIKRKSMHSFLNNDASPIKKTNYQDDLDDLTNKEAMDIDDLPFEHEKSTPNLKNQSIQSKLSALSQSLIKQRLSKLPHEFKVDNRPHSFVLKKIFRPGEKCGPCGKSIGFCGSCYTCRDCRAICHVQCKEKVPMPCIPYMPKANLGKQGRLVLISDFAQPNSVPCVPALIIHCTAEIEKRCLGEVGLYRVPGPDQQVRELRDRILKSKSGMPVLSDVDPHLLCGVVKSFLRHLDESLVTRLAWRDFVKAAMTEDSEEKRTSFMECIGDLPVANRHTLAYLMLHFQRIASSPSCKMPIENLAKVFGPTIVGYSMRDPPGVQMFEENRKQILVMEELLTIEPSYWESLIATHRSDSSESETTESIPSVHQETVIDYRTSRPSIGSRLHGGRVVTGTLAPLKSSSQKRVKNIKPLF